MRKLYVENDIIDPHMDEEEQLRLAIIASIE